MEKVSLMSGSRSVLVGAVLLPCIAAGLALLRSAPGQEPCAPTPAQDDAIADRLAHLEQPVAKAEQLAKAGDQVATRAACIEALAAAQLDHATPEWLAAAESTLWRLGHVAYGSGDLRVAHDAWQAVQLHRQAKLPDDHPDLQVARCNLANTKYALGDLPGALALQEKEFALSSKTLPDDHPDLQRARNNLALTKSALGDLRGALALQEKAFAVSSKTLPDDHSDLQRARCNLAGTRYALGDLPGAQGLFEQVLAVFSRTLPDDHPDLQKARGNLALTKSALGDLRGALVLQEKVSVVFSRILPDDHPELQRARGNLAATKYALGDLTGALVLQEKVLAVSIRTLPDDHPGLQSARLNLAATKYALGDLRGALALEEKTLAVCSRTLPDDHPDLQTARGNLARTKQVLGDLPGALALQEKVLAVSSKTLPDDHPDLQRARNNLAATRFALGDLPGALVLQEKVFAMFSKTLPDDHPDLQSARHDLAATRYALGDLPGALVLQEKVFAVFSNTLPDDHHELQRARGNLAATKFTLGDLRGAAQLNRSRVAGSLRSLFSPVVSMREVTELARAAAEPISHVNRLLDLGDRLPAGTAAELRHDALHLLEATRSAELHMAHLRRVVQARHPEECARLIPQLAVASHAVEGALALPPEGNKTADGRAVARDDAIREAMFTKDSLERELLALVPAELRLAIPPEELAARLDAGEVAISFLTCTRWTNDLDKPWIETGERRYAAFVLTRDGGIQWHSLAPTATVDALIAAVRGDAEAGVALGARSDGLMPGRDPEPVSARSLATPLRELRALLFDPILAALPDGTNALALSLADELHLLPLDELPLASGTSLGEAFDLRTVWSLRVLLHERRERTTTPTALVLGGADYDATPDEAAPAVPTAATPIVEPLATGGSRSGPGDHAFPPLPGTKAEAESLAATFAKSFPERFATTLQGTLASEALFVDAAPGTTFIHLATHGYFAPESAWVATDHKDDSPLARFDVSRSNRGAQLSPYSLAGIALTGANLPADALGRREGILTAQEIVQLDLQQCELATLSACKTSLGVRRAGTGLASLRQAFHAAGARFVLATLWEVNDAEAAKLMADFYDHLWQQGESPRAALRAAKSAAKARGAAFRDWAGWALSGR